MGTERRRLFLRLAGGGLLIATGAVHLDLYLTGYRSIPTIGWLFLLQVIAAAGLGVVVVVSAGWLAAAAAAAFDLATLGGYLLSLWVGLFGFKEVRTAAGIAAGVIEVAAFTALSLLVAADAGPGGSIQTVRRAGLPGHQWVAVAAGLAALVVLGASVTAAGPPAPAAGGRVVKAASISGVTVLTDGKGLTLYWFAPDTATRSACYGSCAAYWPPVIGPVAAGSGVTGALSTITRSDGSVQAAYDGHPLYTYVGDSRPGQANGNGLNLNGGLWHEVTASSG